MTNDEMAEFVRGMRIRDEDVHLLNSWFNRESKREKRLRWRLESAADNGNVERFPVLAAALLIATDRTLAIGRIMVLATEANRFANIRKRKRSR